MKKILVPTDFSKFAEAALQVAVNIAKITEGEVTLLHVVYTGYDAQITVSESEEKIDTPFNALQLTDEIQALKEKCRKMLAGQDFPSLKYQIVSGNVTQAVADYAKQGGFDVIVMGTQGETNDEHWLVGSNTEKMVRYAPCPVLSVRRAPKYFDLKNIVLACDLDDKKALPIEKVKAIQALFGAQLHLVYVNTPSSFSPTHLIRHQVNVFAKKYDLQNYTFHLYCDYTEDDGINHFAESISANMIVMISHQKRGIARLLSGSVSEGVVYEAVIPVLTIGI